MGLKTVLCCIALSFYLETSLLYRKLLIYFTIYKRNFDIFKETSFLLRIPLHWIIWTYIRKSNIKLTPWGKINKVAMTDGVILQIANRKYFDKLLKQQIIKIFFNNKITKSQSQFRAKSYIDFSTQSVIMTPRLG